MEKKIFLCQFVVLLSCLSTAFAVTCLSCKGVIQPRYCTRVRQCPQHNTCGVQKYLTVSGEVRYDVDCVSDEVCRFNDSHPPVQQHRTTTPAGGIIVGRREGPREGPRKKQVPASISLECSECCKGDLCNAQGCGIAGYPVDRGLICYNCPQDTDPSRCEAITFCRKDQLCGLYTEEIFGDKFYSSRCVPKYECDIISHPRPGFGKRQAGAFNERICGPCCTTDLCNNQCGGNTAPTPFITTGTLTTPSTKFYTTGTLTTRRTYTSTPRTTDTTTMFWTSPAPRYHGSNWTEFVVMFKQQYSSSNGVVQVLISSDTNNTIRVKLPSAISGGRVETHNMTRGALALNFSTSLRGKNDEMSYKALLINATHPISVFGLNEWVGSTEGYMALPVEGLGTEYKLPSYEPSQKTANFMIAAVEDNTHVSINVKSKSRVYYSGSYYDSSNNLTLNLNRLQTFHLTHDHDLTGTRIVSDKPIAVISGTVCSIVSIGFDNCEDLTEYLPPIKYWGVEVVVPDFLNVANYSVKILSAEKNARVTVSDRNHHTSVIDIADDVMTLNYSSKLPLYLKSTSPILVTVFAGETPKEGRMGSMFTVPPVSAYKNRYNIPLPKISKFSNMLEIMVKTSDVSGLRLNGSPSPILRASPRNLTYNGASYSVIHIPVSDLRAHDNAILSHVDPKVKFGVISYGVSTLNHHPQVYSYPAGMFLHMI